jgi:hypothetical protein
MNRPPATRLEVHRHRLEDERATHLRDARGYRKSRRIVNLQPFRACVTHMLTAACERITRKPVPASVDTPVIS